MNNRIEKPEGQPRTGIEHSLAAEPEAEDDQEDCGRNESRIHGRPTEPLVWSDDVQQYEMIPVTKIGLLVQTSWTRDAGEGQPQQGH
jgi:hypothetical protein